MLTYLQAVVIGALQGVTELFPVSSLGHSVLVPAWIGGSWQNLVTQSSSGDSSSSHYLTFIVALHVATACALLLIFRHTWGRVILGFLRSCRRSVMERSLVVEGSDERLAWLIVVATIPVGLTGLLLEHTFRVLFAKPLAVALFLTLNGAVLLLAEQARRHSERAAQPGVAAATVSQSAGGPAVATAVPRRTVDDLTVRDALVVGLLQITALFAGISRSGVTMVGGLWRGLDHDDAAHFAFLLATPVILAAGVLKLPSLLGPGGAGIGGQVVVGSLVAGTAAWLSTKFLLRWFTTRTLTPFAIYCLLAGGLSILRFA